MSISPFRSAIRHSLANPSLQAALDANAERRVKARLAAWATLPDPAERRQRAQSVRREVIAHLDQYLAEFITNAQANGAVIHRARDAAEAVQIVLQIVAAAPAGAGRDGANPGRLIAKSKSMVSEEIELNPALEAAGHRVVETDLGEYIVQLRGERPAHIITPAIHLRRQDVGQLFHEKLGIPYTEDIPTLTQTARRVLREVFLTAEVGISGVNFAVAQTGDLCLVTNEGNGRMVTSLPPVHIALLGIERLVPTLDDLALMLSLLARSATGQKLSVYTQLLRLPMPGQQRHVILVDNGRRAVRESPLKDALYCIRCGACLNACPVFREIGGHGYVGLSGQPVAYSGPIGSVISAGLLGGSEFDNLAQASSLCGACKEACPIDIDLPKLLLRVRAGQVPTAKVAEGTGEGPPAGGVGLGWAFKWGLRLYTRAARRPRLFAAGQRLLGWLSIPLPAFLRLPASTGWGLSKDFPKPDGRSFRARWSKLPSLPRSGKEVDVGDAESRPADNPPVAEATVGPGTSREDLLESFGRELDAVGGSLRRVDTAGLPTQVVALLQSRGIDRLHLEPGILDEAALLEAGIEITHEPDPSAGAGLTRALCGLADTGSILVSDGPGSPLQASLLPGIHMAVLKAGDILPSLDEALRLPAVASARATVIITGPSRTGDIEMSHTIGVHGPGEVHVFILDD